LGNVGKVFNAARPGRGDHAREKLFLLWSRAMDAITIATDRSTVQRRPQLAEVYRVPMGDFVPVETA
jgi:hypothetical protein